MLKRFFMMSNLRLIYIVIILIAFISIFTLFEMQVVEMKEKNRQLEALLAYTQSSSSTEVKSPEDNLVVIYNRVPKTGSTSFVGVAYDLCKKNKFHVLHINITANMHVLSLPNQYRFVQNITTWNTIKPALYHGHMAFLDFSRLGIGEKPLFINIIRKPLDRLVSYYYFLRYGDNFRPSLVRRKHGDKMTFDECVAQSQSDCDPNNMWLQIPFFCGHSADCWKPGNKWALNKAKENLVNNYLVVGVTEQLSEFISVLEVTLPRMFKGAMDHYTKSNKSHLRQTVQKDIPSSVTVAKIQKSMIWQMENDLYEFAVQQFNFIKRKTLVGLGERPQSYMYEKIRPKF